MRPSSIAVGQAGNVYVADGRNHRVFRIGPAGTVFALAGPGETGHSGDGGPGVKARVQAEHLTVDAEGNVYVAGGNRVRRIDSSGTITTVAGTGWDRSSGNGSAATATGLSVSGIAAGPSGNLWIADRENRQIRVLRRCRSRPVKDACLAPNFPRDSTRTARRSSIVSRNPGHRVRQWNRARLWRASPATATDRAQTVPGVEKPTKHYFGYSRIKVSQD